MLILLIGLGAAIGPSHTTSVQSTSAPVATQTSQSSSSTSASSTSSSSTTSSTTSSSSTSSTTSTTSSSSGPLAIAISQVISDPPDAQASSSVYIYDVTLTNNGQTSYPVNDFYFTMISASNTVYNPTFVGAIQQSLPSLELAQGQKATGQVAFQIPASETPAKLEYHIPFSINEFVTNLPTPNGAVSEPNLVINANVQGAVDAYGVPELMASPSILNNTFYFYTGQIIAIKVAFTNFFTGTTATVNSIASNTTGLSISQTSPSLPVMVVGSGNGVEVDVIVYMVAPATSFTGTITLDVTASG